MVALGLGVGIAPDVVINNSPVKDKIQHLKVAPIKSFKIRDLFSTVSTLQNTLNKSIMAISQNKFIKT